MLRRTAKTGQLQGQAFWGCSGYPDCKGTRPIESPQYSLTSQTRQTSPTRPTTSRTKRTSH
jgi:ssDNA-binding Zn-finger/Zn-ribbon topoisomerase 1